jgi:hypothetical protein
VKTNPALGAPPPPPEPEDDAVVDAALTVSAAVWLVIEPEASVIVTV